ncbi:hypothetical protein QSV34_13285 [Porticoccus sp. W117]|uniref:hypothetical protein n=1 Tax=Porticoccus sp. W117 TaxID=3054777 RepID=UPI0025978FFE|nr:hypothetical protein [Porticoccus sp. W117]MDM3872323.1 hypothetical protein [Porticoccus sp. W117]
MNNIDNIYSKLAEFPPKTGRPLMYLLQKGLISNKAIQDIIDAGELSGNLSMLLAFGIGYQYLLASRVPVSDTIKMAKELGHPVNLGWSGKRWK